MPDKDPEPCGQATRNSVDTVAGISNRALEQIRWERHIDPEKDILQKNLAEEYDQKKILEEVSKCGYMSGNLVRWI